ncbi:hypothetical protein ADUPG1_013814, partial [Aduncisulcus paluster]
MSDPYFLAQNEISSQLTHIEETFRDFDRLHPTVKKMTPELEFLSQRLLDLIEGAAADLKMLSEVVDRSKSVKFGLSEEEIHSRENFCSSVRKKLSTIKNDVVTTSDSLRHAQQKAELLKHPSSNPSGRFKRLEAALKESEEREVDAQIRDHDAAMELQDERISRLQPGVSRVKKMANQLGEEFKEDDKMLTEIIGEVGDTEQKLQTETENIRKLELMMRNKKQKSRNMSDEKLEDICKRVKNLCVNTVLWTKRVEVLLELERAVLGDSVHAPSFSTIVSRYLDTVIDQLMTDRRSAVLKRACHTLEILSVRAGTQLSKFATSIMPQLIKLQSLSGLVFTQMAQSCIEAMIVYCSPSSALSYFSGIVQKQGSIATDSQTACVYYTSLFIDTHGVDGLDSSLRKKKSVSDIIIKTVVAAIKGKAPKTRAEGRRCLFLLNREDSTLAQQALSHLTGSHQKYARLALSGEIGDGITVGERGFMSEAIKRKHSDIDCISPPSTVTPGSTMSSTHSIHSSPSQPNIRRASDYSDVSSKRMHSSRSPKSSFNPNRRPISSSSIASASMSSLTHPTPSVGSRQSTFSSFSASARRAYPSSMSHYQHVFDSDEPMSVDDALTRERRRRGEREEFDRMQREKRRQEEEEEQQRREKEEYEKEEIRRIKEERKREWAEARRQEDIRQREEEERQRLAEAERQREDAEARAEEERQRKEAEKRKVEETRRR